MYSFVPNVICFITSWSCNNIVDEAGLYLCYFVSSNICIDRVLMQPLCGRMVHVLAVFCIVNLQYINLQDYKED